MDLVQVGMELRYRIPIVGSLSTTVSRRKLKLASVIEIRGDDEVGFPPPPVGQRLTRRVHLQGGFRTGVYKEPCFCWRVFCCAARVLEHACLS